MLHWRRSMQHGYDDGWSSGVYCYFGEGDKSATYPAPEETERSVTRSWKAASFSCFEISRSRGPT
jgi:hypothetical protein